ncbi:MAG TPA: flavodoxin family protein [Burkholderiales bacterium]|nr:flavodoxin family protein [Burkholderiales bacterium]
MPKVRKGQAPGKLSRAEFKKRFDHDYVDSTFDSEREALDRIEAIAWHNYQQSRKAPHTRKAGPGYADPDYDLSVEWIEAKERIDAARKRQEDPATPSRVLVICGAARNDGTCPGEMSKSFRLSQVAIEILKDAGIEADLLDLSLLTSEYGRRIFPCKACVSTAMPLCHWPCSCYPNHSLGQTDDWMNEIYERWTAAHGILIITPVYWYQTPGTLKLMIDRLVCADGGNPDPTSTHGKDAGKAKEIELAGWPYPKHLDGRTYGVVVHGDVAGTEATRRALCDWLDWMGLIDAGPKSRLDRMICYYGTYAESHDDMDKEPEFIEEVRNAARSVAEAVGELRAGRLSRPGKGLENPRPK